MELKQMIQGRIYFISYGNTQLVVRYNKSDITQNYYYDALHYWNGFETFYRQGYFIHSGIEEVRPATKCEKHNLLKNAIENETI